MSDTRQLAPMIFFGTDEVRNDGVRDFRPTAASAVRAEEQKKAADDATVDEQFSAPEETPDGDPKDLGPESDPEATAKAEHPVSAESATVDTSSPAGHPDLDLLFGAE